jgi:hypothetical protein
MFTSVPASESAIGTTAPADAAIHASGSSDATTKRSAKYAATVAAGVFLFSLLSPEKATAQQERVSAATDLSVIATTAGERSHAAIATPGGCPPTSAVGRNLAMELTSHSPWLAPICHWQPRSVDVPQGETWSAWERVQRRLEAKLDQKLIICRNC